MARLRAALRRNVEARQGGTGRRASAVGLTYWPDLGCTSGGFEVLTLDALAARFAGAGAAQKAALPSFSAGRFGTKHSGAGSLRHGANLIECTAIVGDHDAGTLSPAEAADHLRAAGVRGAIFSTSSHTPMAPRWRVVVPLGEPCPAVEYRRHVDRLDAILGGGVLAPESRVPVQLWFYGHIVGQSKPEVHVVAEGAAIDETAEDYARGGTGDESGDELADALPARSTSRFGLQAPIEVVASALAALPNDGPVNWERWNHIGMAAFGASGGSEDGLTAWLAWSAKHPGHDGSMCQERWEHFHRSRPTEIGAGALIHEATQAGWCDPRKDAPPDSGGDLSNARILADQMRGRFLYDRSARRWRCFDGVRWASDSGQAMQAAKAVADQRLRDAARALADSATEEAKRRFSQAQRIHQSAQRIEAMLRLAQSEPGLSVDGADFDRDPWLLGVPNGVVDLRAGTLREATPADMVTKVAGFPFDPAARCPRWECFLTEIFSDDVEVTSFMQRAAGYSLTGDAREEVALFAHGSGRNGKSIFATILHRIFGDYAVVVGTELLARRRNDNEAARLKLRLRGARLALANELSEGDVWDDRALKEVVSREAFSARQLYGEAIDVVPTHHIWIRANHRPAALDAGDGFWRRLILIPFARHFPPGGPEDLDQQILAAEGAGILAWAVRGCLEWQRGGLRVPAALRGATDQYRSDTDILGQWFSDEMVRDPANVRGVTVADAYSSAQRFHEAAGMSAPSRPAFTRRVARLGLHARRSNNVDRFPGFALRTWPEDDGGDGGAL